MSGYECVNRSGCSDYTRPHGCGLAGCKDKNKQNDLAITGLNLTMFITFIQTKGLWPCFMQIGESPEPIKAEALFKLIEEFKTFAS